MHLYLNHHDRHEGRKGALVHGDTKCERAMQATVREREQANLLRPPGSDSDGRTQCGVLKVNSVTIAN